VPHGAYTDGTEMRAIVIELPVADSRVLTGAAASALAEHGSPDAPAKKPEPAQGRLADRPRLRSDYDSSEGEPW
jgi:hypothetical protein